MTGDEYVVLADADGRPDGVALKSEVHTTDTPLHFAFSAYVLRADGKLLMTRRALSKVAWPGVWTNSFCGHPGPGELAAHAVRRRAGEELGIAAERLVSVKNVVPDFRYRAVDSSGIVENEICPVFIVRVGEGGDELLDPNAAEVDSWFWIEPAALLTAVDNAPRVFSPWCVGELADQRLRGALTMPKGSWWATGCKQL